jgi:small subunit ribosomal protein S11
MTRPLAALRLACGNHYSSFSVKNNKNMSKSQNEVLKSWQYIAMPNPLFTVKRGVVASGFYRSPIFASYRLLSVSSSPKPLRYLTVNEPPIIAKVTDSLPVPKAGAQGSDPGQVIMRSSQSSQNLRPAEASNSQIVPRFVGLNRPPTRASGYRPKINQPSTGNYIHVQTTLNNTIITLTDLKGNVLFTVSGGSLGFKNSRKATTYAAQLIGEDIAKKCFQLGIRTVEVKLKGIGYGKESSLRGLSAGGLFIKKIEDVTSLPHNGCRLPKKRRL